MEPLPFLVAAFCRLLALLPWLCWPPRTPACRGTSGTGDVRGFSPVLSCARSCGSTHVRAAGAIPTARCQGALQPLQGCVSVRVQFWRCFSRWTLTQPGFWGGGGGGRRGGGRGQHHPVLLALMPVPWRGSRRTRSGLGMAGWVPGRWGHLSAPAAGLGDPEAGLLLLALPVRSDRMQTSLKC